MKFYFDSMNDFFAMGNHGFFVWTSYAIVIVGFAMLIAIPVISRRKFLKDQRAAFARQKRQQEAHTQEPHSQRGN